MSWITANLDIIVWVFCAVVFGIVEACTAAVVSIWFVGGCIVAAIAASIGAPIWLQIMLAIAASAGLLVGFRKMLIAQGNAAPKILASTDTENVEGKVGVVSTEIVAGKPGQVCVNGIEWTARGVNDGDSFAVDTRVVVCRLDGCCCYVEKYEIE